MPVTEDHPPHGEPIEHRDFSEGSLSVGLTRHDVGGASPSVRRERPVWPDGSGLGSVPPLPFGGVKRSGCGRTPAWRTPLTWRAYGRDANRPAVVRVTLAARVLRRTRCCNQRGIDHRAFLLPLTDARERFVGRSERSNFSRAIRKRRATRFSTESTSQRTFVCGSCSSRRRPFRTVALRS